MFCRNCHEKKWSWVVKTKKWEKLLKKNNRVSGAGLEQGKKSARCVEHREVDGPETDDGEPDQERRERWLVRNSGSC